MKKIFLSLCFIFGCVAFQQTVAQNVVNQTTIITKEGTKSANNDSDKDIGGVEFRRIPANDGSGRYRYYYEFENFHSFPVTVDWQTTVSNERYSESNIFGSSHRGTIVIPANSTKRLNETYGRAYDLDFIKVRKL